VLLLIFSEFLTTLELDCYPFIDFDFYDAISTDDYLTTYKREMMNNVCGGV
jgi:hypothetical protein